MNKLKIIHGPFSGQEFELTTDKFMIGRTNDNHVVIPDIMVSRHHAHITFENDHYILIDQSKNGIRVNGKLTKRFILAHDARMEIGPCILCFISA
ncbi:FHA domain-containing protein [candidate division KSB1 bacterium]|nr:FHA domain-containing protein [candidate division KSB1 bacterium]